MRNLSEGLCVSTKRASQTGRPFSRLFASAALILRFRIVAEAFAAGIVLDVDLFCRAELAVIEHTVRCGTYQIRHIVLRSGAPVSDIDPVKAPHAF